MKTIDWKFSTLALIAGMFVFTSCSNNDDDPVIEEPDNSVLQGSIVSDLTLKSANTYTLNGEFLVKEGATLNIEPRQYSFCRSRGSFLFCCRGTLC